MACRGAATGVLQSFVLCQDAAVQRCRSSFSSDVISCLPEQPDRARVHSVAVCLRGDCHSWRGCLLVKQGVEMKETWANLQICHLANHF